MAAKAGGILNVENGCHRQARGRGVFATDPRAVGDLVVGRDRSLIDEIPNGFAWG